MMELKKDEGLQEYTELKYIDLKAARFEKTIGGFLSLKIADKEYKRINVHRTFPFTNPDLYISVSDEDKKEIGFISDLNLLKSEYKKLIEDELGVRYFTPEITKVINIKEEFGYYYWEVETDAGHRKFTVQSGHNNMKTLNDIQLLIVDVDGNRYKMSDVNSMESKHLKVIGALI